MIAEQAALGSAAVRFIRPAILAGHPYILPEAYPTRPIDLESGLPYCFMPNPDLPAVRLDEKNLARRADWDHQYPRVEVRYSTNPVLDHPDARYGLLNLRLQWTAYPQHHDIWNNCEMIGPMQPATAQQLAATFVLGLGGFVPPVGLELRQKRPIERKLSEHDRRTLWESGQLRIGNETPIIAYLRRYVLAQDVDHINESELNEFLDTHDRERKLYLGHTLAAKIVERAVEPFGAVYSTAQKQGLLSVRNAARRTLSEAPNNPRDLVKAKLSSGRRFGPVMDAMAHKLAMYRETA
ncbi:MAG: hypothetical protein WDN27_04070 [Candidatus Saccharibacteria bacterium]